MSKQHWLNDTNRGKLKYSEETCPIASLSSINPTWTGPGMDPGLCGDWQAASHLSHSMNRDWFNICINSTGHGTG